MALWRRNKGNSAPEDQKISRACLLSCPLQQRNIRAFEAQSAKFQLIQEDINHICVKVVSDSDFSEEEKLKLERKIKKNRRENKRRDSNRG